MDSSTYAGFGLKLQWIIFLGCILPRWILLFSSICIFNVLGHFILYFSPLKFVVPYNIVAFGFLGTVFILYGWLLKTLCKKHCCMNSWGSVWDTFVICFSMLITFCSYFVNQVLIHVMLLWIQFTLN